MTGIISNQAFFNKVKKHLLTQGFRCTEDGGETCVYYRKEDGARCAIGGTLPVEVARRIRQNEGTVGVIFDWSFIAPYMPESFDLATKLQQLHDTVKPSRWKYGLNRIAKHFELTK